MEEKEAEGEEEGEEEGKEEVQMEGEMEASGPRPPQKTTNPVEISPRNRC